MRLAGCTWKSISKVTGYSERHCRQIHRDAVARVSGEIDVEQACRNVGVRIESLLQVLECYVFDECDEDTPPPPTKVEVRDYIRAIELQMKLLGFDKRPLSPAMATGPVPTVTDPVREAEREATRRRLVDELLGGSGRM